jgi:anthranilate synthase/aminodeoxychorismate synthase-like glutamine amidotransferase
VVRNTAIDAAGALQLAPQAIVLSPGPCTPAEAGCSIEVVRRLAGQVPILGVCLGHQVIGEAFGAAVVRAPQPMHGRTSDIRHASSGVFAGLPNPLTAGRYHSLVVDEATLPPDLEATAHTSDGVLMAIEHRKWPVVGVQFHPESILTEAGYDLLANFLRLAGIEAASHQPSRSEELLAPDEAPQLLPTGPVTF